MGDEQLTEETEGVEERLRDAWLRWTRTQQHRRGKDRSAKRWKDNVKNYVKLRRLTHRGKTGME